LDGGPGGAEEAIELLIIGVEEASPCRDTRK